MIEVKDRVPTYPGRVRLTPVSGQANTYDMVRADEPIEPGTPINRALFLSLLDDINAIRQQVDDKIFELSQRVRVGDLDDGAEFGLYENGVLVPFIKITSNYSSTGRVLAVRKNCVTSAILMNEEEKYYTNCKTDAWLNNEYISTLDAATQSVLSAIKVAVFTNVGTVDILRKVFILSLYEYRASLDSSDVLGIPLSYFTTAERRISNLNGTPTNHWTRSTDVFGLNSAYITKNGDFSVTTASTFTAGIRPAFTLPVDFEVTVGVPSQENVMATAEVL